MPDYTTKNLAELVWEKDAERALRATFSRFNVVDHDGDVTLPSAFADGQAVPMVWSHDWDKPVGKGRIEVKADRAVFAGAFFDTAAGVEAYRTVKQMGDLQEYSYGFRVLDAAPGTLDGVPVRFLKGMQVYEVSPVLVGAGIGTGTDRIKRAEREPAGEDVPPEEKPFANEHACRLADPDGFDRFRRVNGDQSSDGKPIDVIYGHPKAGGGWRIQALRYPTSSWSATAARGHCAGRDGSFEAAAKAVDDPVERYVAQVSRVLADLGDLRDRSRAIQTLRREQGRTPCSGKQREALTALLAALTANRGDVEELLRTPDPRPDLEALRASFARLHPGGA